MKTALIATGVMLVAAGLLYALPTNTGTNTTGTTGGTGSEPLQYWLGGSQYQWGDLDFDGDVDQADFLIFQDCFAGPNRPSKKPGLDADWDRDGDVDQADFLAFQDVFSGPNNPPKLGKARPAPAQAENPEPLSLVLVASALGGLAIERRRRAARRRSIS